MLKWAKFLVVAGLIGSSAVQAQDSTGEGFFGPVAGLMSVDVDGDNPFNAGFRGGYTWNSGWGIEAELTRSLSDGAYYDVDYSINTFGVYGTYRSAGQLYFKGKLGYLSETVNFDESYWSDSHKESDTGLSAGAGLGFHMARNAYVEAEYTLIEEDVDFFSASLVFRF
ncbi:porin family protein [Microbulbifer agarilyticus]